RRGGDQRGHQPQAHHRVAAGAVGGEDDHRRRDALADVVGGGVELAAEAVAGLGRARDRAVEHVAEEVAGQHGVAGGDRVALRGEVDPEDAAEEVDDREDVLHAEESVSPTHGRGYYMSPSRLEPGTAPPARRPRGTISHSPRSNTRSTARASSAAGTAPSRIRVTSSRRMPVRIGWP